MMSATGLMLRTLAYHGGPLLLKQGEAALLDVAPMASHADEAKSIEQLSRKVRLLASLLTLPDDVSSRRLLDLLADLAKSTRMGGACLQSPFTVRCGEIVAESLHDLDRHVLDDEMLVQGETDIDRDRAPVAAEKCEAA